MGTGIVSIAAAALCLYTDIGGLTGFACVWTWVAPAIWTIVCLGALRRGLEILRAKGEPGAPGGY